MKKYVEPEVEYVQLITEAITSDDDVNLDAGDSGGLVPPSWVIN